MDKQYYPLNKVPATVQKMGGKRVSISCVYRWASRGVQRVRLRTLAIGGTLYTCDEWVERFFESVAEARFANSDAQVAPTRRSKLSKAAAEAELAEFGV